MTKKCDHCSDTFPEEYEEKGAWDALFPCEHYVDITQARKYESVI